MLRKILRFLIAIVLIGALVLGIYYFTSTRNQGGLPGEAKKNLSFRDFLPFGNKSNSTTTTEYVGDELKTDLSAPVVETPKKMHKISSRRVVDIVSYQKEKFIPAVVTETQASSTSKKKNVPVPPPQIEITYGVRFLEKTSGFIFEIMDALPSIETRISDSITPVLGEGMIGNNGNSLIARFVRQEDDSTIDTFVGNIVGLSAPSKVSGSFLTRNAVSVSVSPDSSRYFVISPIVSGVNGVINSFVGNSKQLIFNSPFTEWASSWTSPNTITLFPKPSGLVNNIIYSLDATTGEIKKLLGGILGLTGTLSPNGKLLAYSYTVKNSMFLTIYDPVEFKGKNTGLQTLSDKCVFSPDSLYLYCAIPNSVPSALYPDDWYKGKVQFSDSFWKLDVTNQAYYLLVDTNVTGDSVDAINLKVSKDGNSLYFINKMDDTPWVVDTR